VRRVYNILFTALLVIGAPFLLGRLWLRGGWRPGFRHRFGRYDPKFKQAITNRHVVWIHTGPARELNILTQLIRAFETRLPNAKLVVSTTSTASMQELRRHLPSQVGRIYFPLDRRSWVSRALSTLNPQAVILTDPDMWPNFLWRARHRGTPVFLAAGRLSARSRKRLERFSFWFRPLMSSLAGVAAHSEADAAEYVRLGCRSQTVRVVGNLDLDAANLVERRRLDVPALFRQLGVRLGAPVVVAGGTQPGEEGALADALLELKKSLPGVFLVLAPAQVQRSRQVGRELEARRIRYVYRNEVMRHTQFNEGELDCLLLNTTGELSHFYAHATVVFAGGSLAGTGGEDLIEAAVLGKPILFGPRPNQSAELAGALVSRGGAVQAGNAAGLAVPLAALLSNEARHLEMGKKALAVAQESLGAINRTVAMVLEHLDEEVYVAPAP